MGPPFPGRKANIEVGTSFLNGAGDCLARDSAAFNPNAIFLQQKIVSFDLLKVQMRLYELIATSTSQRLSELLANRALSSTAT